MTHLVKQKNPNYGQMLAAPEGGCKLMGGEAASPTYPEEGRSDELKINMHTV